MIIIITLGLMEGMYGIGLCGVLGVGTVSEILITRRWLNCEDRNNQKRVRFSIMANVIMIAYFTEWSISMLLCLALLCGLCKLANLTAPDARLRAECL